MNNSKIKKAVIYCRTATKDQKTDKSLKYQEDVCRESAKKDGIKVLKVINDFGYSGISLDRSGIQEIIRMVNERSIDIVYTTHGDRISRSTLDYLNIRKLFQNNNVLLKCVYQPMPDSSAASRTMDAIMTTFSEMQRYATSDKTKQALYTKVKNGYFPAIPPLGYQSVIDNGKRIIIPNKEKASLIKKIFKLYANSKCSISDLNELMNKKGLLNRHGKKLSSNSIRNLLKNRFYLGEIKFGNVYNKNGKHKSLIDKQLFNKVQVALKSK